jgi:hypothetical protein
MVVLVVLFYASIHVARASPWVAEAVLLVLGGHGGPWATRVGMDLVAGIHVARSIYLGLPYFGGLTIPCNVVGGA